MDTYLDGLKYLLARKVRPGPFTSQDWASVAPAIRQRAFFSATINSARVLHRMRSMLLDWQSGAVETILTPSGATETAFKETGLAKFREKAADLLVSEGLASKSDFKNESIKNVVSNSRLKLIFNTNTAQAQDFAIYQSRVADPERINRFPAAEFVRTPGARVPRDRHVANEGAIRRYDDLQFWLNQNAPDIGGFGVPWGPWGFNSYMTTFPIPRRRAEKLGLVKPGEKVMPPDLTQFGVTLPTRLNKGVTASVDDITPEIRQQAINTITARLGPQALRPDGKLTLEALQALRSGGTIAPAPAPAPKATKAPAPVRRLPNARTYDNIVDKLNKAVTNEVWDSISTYEKADIDRWNYHKSMLDNMVYGKEKERLEYREKWLDAKARLATLQVAYDKALEVLRDTVSIPVRDRGSMNLTSAPIDANYWQKNMTNLIEGRKIIERYVSKNLLTDVRVNKWNDREKADYGEIFVNGNTKPSTVAHEITHVIEMDKKDVLKKSMEFLQKRAKGQKAKSLKKLTGIAYRKWEFAYEDDWAKLGGNVYSGKVYNGATEILTMGIERLHENPLKFYRTDPEYFEFVVRTLQELP